MAIRFDGKVAVVTGAGAGLGRTYAIELARRGAKVVINDLGGSASGVGKSLQAADAVVAEIKAAGGVAVASYDSVEQGAKIIETAIKAFGRVDILINNAGVLRDRSFAKMSEQDWNTVLNVHLVGTYRVTKAAWPYMIKQGYGRIINTTSGSALYGNFGQTNYSAAKSGVIGFTRSLSKEGERKNVFVNVIAPIAASRLTATVLSSEALAMYPPEKVSPVVLYLSHEDCKETGAVLEVGGGMVTAWRLHRSKGAFYLDGFTAEQLEGDWSKVMDYSEWDLPTGPTHIIGNVLEVREKLTRPKL
jgi:NAD(P)-dependent dehydrogenase (short-subunit alcohol dehydrogenase family)